MADKTYDVVVVGAGNKSLITAMYLAKFNNLSVGVFEERHEAAAGWCSEEAMGGGFMNDPCSSMMVHYPMYFGPVWDDFPELRDYGMRFIPHPVGPAIVLPDGRALCIHSEEFDPQQAKTAASIAAFSKSDAEQWLRLWGFWKSKWQQALYDFLFNPLRGPDKDPLAQLFANPKENGVDPYWLARSPLQLARELFESPELVHLICRVADTGGYPATESGLGFMNLLVTLFWTGGIAAARGGTHNNAHACVRALAAQGGEIFYRQCVKKIIIENGRATGIVLDDGSRISAKVAVVTGVDIHQLMFELVGKQYFAPIDVRRVNILFSDFNSLYWYQNAFSEHPRLKAMDYDPNVQWSGFTFLLQKEASIEGILEYDAYRRLGKRVPKGVIEPVYVDHSRIDRTRSPEGTASILTDVFNTSYTGHKTDREFMRDYKEIIHEYLEVFSRFHTNITQDKHLAYSIEGPKALAGISRSYRHGNWNCLDFSSDQYAPNRPTPGLANGKMPVEGLYATGMCFQQGGWAGAWNGYALYKLMANELGLGKPWEDKGRDIERVEVAYRHLERFRVIPSDVPDFPKPVF